MQALSSEDGSAEAVREAAAVGLAQGDHRLALERELDRLNVAVQGSAAALGQHLSWMLVAQAFLLVAYVIVLVGGWNVPLPGKRWLLTGIAAFAVVAVTVTYLGLRAARDRVGPLKAAPPAGRRRARTRRRATAGLRTTGGDHGDAGPGVDARTAADRLRRMGRACPLHARAADADRRATGGDGAE